MIVQQMSLGGNFCPCVSALICANGSCTPESSKLYTYISSHGDSVIDYFAMSSYGCKKILGFYSQSPNHMVYGELGRHHLSVLVSTR